MTDASDSELEALRALQIVENQLEEAEETVWKASTDNEQLDNQLDDLTQEIWSLQQSVEEIQTHFE
jgi:predicted RNase H-like nuclease (RuvC/YqgF family)